MKWKQETGGWRESTVNVHGVCRRWHGVQQNMKNEAWGMRSLKRLEHGKWSIRYVTGNVWA